MRLTNDFELFSPLQKPDWRYRRVQHLLQRGERCTRRDHGIIRSLHRFLRRWQAREFDRDELLYEEPALYYAVYLHEQSLRQPHATTLLQAWLLAGADDKTIAQQLGMIPEAVQAFEMIFFEVRQKLRNQTWIYQQVLVPIMAHKRRIPAPPGLDGSLLLASYLGGAVLLDQLIGGCQSGAPMDRLDLFLQAHVKRQAAMAAVNFDAESISVDKLLQLFRSVHEWPNKPNELAMFEKHVQAFLGQVGDAYNVGNPLDKKLAATPLGELDDCAAELRDEELMQAARGVRPENADEIKNLDNVYAARIKQKETQHE